MFYGGLVHRKNVVSTFIKSVAISSVIFVVWMIIGYSLAFGSGNWFIGDFSKFALNHIDFSHIAKNVMNPRMIKAGMKVMYHFQLSTNIANSKITCNSDSVAAYSKSETL